MAGALTRVKLFPRHRNGKSIDFSYSIRNYASKKNLEDYIIKRDHK